MNWKNIKTFLIFLFLTIDLFLIVLTYISYNSAKLSDSDINDTISILQNNGIYISPAVIPRRSADKNSIPLTNIYFSDIAQNKNITIEYSDNNIFVEIPCNSNGINNSNATDMILSTLKKYSFDTDNIHIHPNADNTYTMTYTINGLPVFNNNMKITVMSDSLQLTGTWYEHKSQNTYTGKNNGSAYATSALISFVSHPEANDTNTEITDITLGYYADLANNSDNIKIVSASSCYMLTTDDNKVYYYSIPENKFLN